jgi:hypothetical protein
MIQIKAGELFIFTPDGAVTLNEGLQRLSSAELSAAVSFRVARTIRKIGAELEAFQKTRLEMFKRFGEESGGGYRIPPERIAEFQAQLAGLLAVEIELDARPLLLADLNGCNLRPRDMLDLEKFVLEEPPK